MTPTDKLIAEVLSLDAVASEKPWIVRRDESIENGAGGLVHADGREHIGDAALIASYRTAAPLLARMLRVAMDNLGNPMDDIDKADLLTEIDRIAKDGEA